MGTIKTAEQKIARLEAINVKAKERITQLRAKHANEHQVGNVVKGIQFREAEIARLRK